MQCHVVSGAHSFFQAVVFAYGEKSKIASPSPNFRYVNQNSKHSPEVADAVLFAIRWELVESSQRANQILDGMKHITTHQVV